MERVGDPLHGFRQKPLRPLPIFLSVGSADCFAAIAAG